jgi:glycosyltransferase involved in cell wall biosynthesis
MIPAYNAQRWIGDTIRSALAQTWPRIEIVIVDDGSTDHTLDIARQYEFSNVRIISQENRGGCAARNRALQECQGVYIQWLDADDLLAPDKIEAQLNLVGNDTAPEVLFSSAWGTFYYRPKNAEFRRTSLWQDLDAVDWLVSRLSNAWFMPVSTWLVSRGLTEKAGPWDERLFRNQDGEYFCRMVSHSSYVKFVPESRFYYRKADVASITHSRSRNSLESLCLSIELEVCHVLRREDSERTRGACVKRLNYGASRLEDAAPELAYRLRIRIGELGGEVMPKRTSRKNAIIQKIMGKRRTKILKETVWRTHVRISRTGDRLMGKLFGTEI